MQLQHIRPAATVGTIRTLITSPIAPTVRKKVLVGPGNGQRNVPGAGYLAMEALPIARLTSLLPTGQSPLPGLPGLLPPGQSPSPGLPGLLSPGQSPLRGCCHCQQGNPRCHSTTTASPAAPPSPGYCQPGRPLSAGRVTANRAGSTSRPYRVRWWSRGAEPLARSLRRRSNP